MYGVKVTMPGPLAVYEAAHQAVQDATGPEPVDGLVVHFAQEQPDGVQIVEVWTSRQASERYNTEVVWPALEKLMAGQPGPTEPPALEEFEVHGLLLGAAAHT